MKKKKIKNHPFPFLLHMSNEGKKKNINLHPPPPSTVKKKKKENQPTH
jgi:hypothetical protein